MTEYEIRWRNVGISPHPRLPWFCISTPWGNLIVKDRESILFSERYGYQKRPISIGPMTVKWVRLRRSADD